jgi:phytoene dehydrogenase-like protein
MWKDMDRKTYLQEKEIVKNSLLAKFHSITGIPIEKAEISVAATPCTMEFYSSNVNGAVFGAEMTNLSNNKSIRNLYLVGADATTAGSVVSAFDSGLTASKDIKSVITSSI